MKKYNQEKGFKYDNVRCVAGAVVKAQIMNTNFADMEVRPYIGISIGGSKFVNINQIQKLVEELSGKLVNAE
jgi:hypothetical protein